MADDSAEEKKIKRVKCSDDLHLSAKLETFFYIYIFLFTEFSHDRGPKTQMSSNQSVMVIMSLLNFYSSVTDLLVNSPSAESLQGRLRHVKPSELVEKCITIISTDLKSKERSARLLS